MLDSDTPSEPELGTTPTTPTPSGDTGAAVRETPPEPVKKAAKKAPAKKAAAKKTVAKKAAAKKPAAKKAAAAPAEPSADAPAEAPSGSGEQSAQTEPAEPAPARKTAKKAAKKTAAKTTRKRAAADAGAGSDTGAPETPAAAETPVAAETPAAAKAPGRAPRAAKKAASTTPVESDAGRPVSADDDTGDAAVPPTMLLFQPPDTAKAKPSRKRTTAKTAKSAEAPEADEAPAPAAATPVEAEAAPTEPTEATAAEATHEEDDEETGTGRRRRRRGGRRRRKNGHHDDHHDDHDEHSTEAAADAEEAKHGTDGPSEGSSGTTRRRRKRRRSGEEGDSSPDDPENTVTRVRKGRNAADEITSLAGSTRLEAKKQRRREGREAGRRRAPIVSEAEFLARRESVDRLMVIRQREDLTQIAVLEDKVLVEHYVARESQTSLIGNVYLGRVQNVLPSMEAAFIDIGKGRNAVLYAGEVNWDALGAKDGARKIEQVLKSGQTVLVQVSKDPIGHKGARLTSQISLPGRFLVYVPDGTTSGISRKLPDTERSRLKTLLKQIVPDSAGVIVRTAAEGASEEELTRDVERLTARWDDIAAKADKGRDKGGAPQMLYGEPDLTLKVVRDLFTEDFGKLVVAGDDAWDMVQNYVEHVAPDLADRLERYDGQRDVFAEYRIDEQIAKGLDRKVWLPSGGSLIIDRTEAMTVVDVNTGKFTGSGGNLEETVTKNNLEAADEIVRQLRLRDIGGIIVVDFIDMVLESNRDLVLRRLVECLGRDRTRHQVAEVTSLGLVQMTRKRIGTGLLEAFSESCEHCQGRGVVLHQEPVEHKHRADEEPRRGRRGRGRGGSDEGATSSVRTPTPKDVAAMAKAAPADEPEPASSEPAVPTEPAQPAEPEHTDEPIAVDEPAAPRVTTRRRGRRAVTPPVAESAPASEATTSADAVPAEEPPAPAAPAEPVAPVAAEPARSVEPAEEPTPAPVPTTPRIVTTVRRRGARREAGPPVAGSNGVPAGSAAGTEAPAVTEPADPATDADGAVGEPEPAAVSVPVKKKGTRKR